MTQEQEHRGFAVEWRALADVAEAIGCDVQTLRNWSKAGHLATQLVKGKAGCQAFQAYDLGAASRRPPEKLKKPTGYGEGREMAPSSAAATLAPLDPEIVAALGGADPFQMDPHDLSRRLLGAGVAVAKVRLAVQISNAVQRRREGELRAGKNIPPDDVVRMLRAGCELFVEEIDASAGSCSSELLRLLRERYGLETAAKFPSMGAQLEDFYRQQAQGILVKLRKKVEEQIRGIQRLEFDT